MSDWSAACLELRPHLRIVHHVPGRIRLRAAASVAAMSGKRQALDRFLSALERGVVIRSVRLSAPTLSAVIEYDHHRLPPTAWTTLLSGPEAAALDTLAGVLGDQGAAAHTKPIP